MFLFIYFLILGKSFHPEFHSNANPETLKYLYFYSLQFNIYRSSIG